MTRKPTSTVYASRAVRIRHPVWLGPSIASLLTLSAGAQDGIAFFTSKVQPILETHCYKCHSHEAGKMKGGLTLDSRSGWEEGGDSGPAVVPGNPAESLLIEAVLHADPDIKMPPKKRLSPDEIQVLTEWVERNAPDPRTARPAAPDEETWWSLAPLAPPAVPPGSAGSNPIDAFIHARLAEKGLRPAPRADRRTLIRRLYFNLHGLPPTPEEVQSFEADSSPGAYRKLVDRLLASPRYGERWARHWLDTIHFADSHGCEHDVKRPNAWPFRDYVIERLNDDVRWDRFIREQLAADVFFPDESHLRAGLGFIAAGPLELSRAGTAPVTFDYLDRDDMVTQTMAAFVSTTANCARCHDHKFDAVTMEDYYSLQAVFAGVGKGDIEFDRDPEVAATRRDLQVLHQAVEARDESILAAKHAVIMDAWEQSEPQKLPVWQTMKAETFLTAEGTTLRRMEDGSLLATGTPPATDTYTISGSTPLKSLTGIRVEVLTDDSLPMKGPGRAPNGNLHLSEFEAYLFDPGAPEARRLAIKRATADWNQEDWIISHALDGDPKTAWGIHPKEGAPHHAVFELEEPLTLEPGSRISIVLKQLHGGSHLLGRLKLSLTDAPGASARVLPDEVLAALRIAPAQRTKEQQLAIAAHVLGAYSQEELGKLPEPTMVYAVSPEWSHAKKLEKPLATPKEVHILKRGDIEKPGTLAQSGALTAIPTLAGRFELPHPEREATRRAALAEWIASPENPLSWRSVVNRVWHYHFGRGLCDTPNDLGRMGGQVSHPELLDWLAVWFRDDAKGSLKALHRLILTSETYQQSFRHANPEAQAIDADNRLLWRMNGHRMDAECYRDALLQISGRIDLTMGGPGIEQFTKSKGPQSTPKLDYQAYDWKQPGAARRSIYRVVWRGIADPFMEALDFPDMALLAPRRGASVSALQALTLYNNEFVLHHSAEFAARLEAESSSASEQVERAVRLVFLRAPTSGERAELTTFANEHGLAALTRVLFNSNEFIFID